MNIYEVKKKIQYRENVNYFSSIDIDERSK